MSLIEHNFTIYTASKIADALGVELVELFGPERSELGQDPGGPENAGGDDGIGDDGSDSGSGGEGGEPGGSDLPDNPYDPGDGFPGDENVDPPSEDPDPSEPDTPSDGPEPEPDLPDQNEPEPQGPRVERWDLSSQGPWSGRDSVTSRGSMDQRIGGTALLIRLVTSGRVSAAVAVSTGGTLAGQTVTVRIMREPARLPDGPLRYRRRGDGDDLGGRASHDYPHHSARDGETGCTLRCRCVSWGREEWRASSHGGAGK